MGDHILVATGEWAFTMPQPASRRLYAIAPAPAILAGAAAARGLAQAFRVKTLTRHGLLWPSPAQGTPPVAAPKPLSGVSVKIRIRTVFPFDTRATFRAGRQISI